MKKIKSIWYYTQPLKGEFELYDKNGHGYFKGETPFDRPSKVKFDNNGNCIEFEYSYDSGVSFRIIVNETFSYDDSGQLLDRTYKAYSELNVFHPRTLEAHVEEHNEYDSAGRCIVHSVVPKLRSYEFFLGEDQELTIREFDNEGNCTYEQGLCGDVKTYEYEDGKCKRVDIGCLDSNGSIIIKDIHLFQYDENGRLLQEHHDKFGFERTLTYQNEILSTENASYFEFLKVKDGKLYVPKFKEGLYRLYPDDFNFRDDFSDSQLYFIKEYTTHKKNTTQKNIQIYLVKYVNKEIDETLDEETFFDFNYSELSSEDLSALKTDLLIGEMNIEEVNEDSKIVVLTNGILNDEKFENKLIEQLDEKNEAKRIEYYCDGELVFEEDFERIESIRFRTNIKATYPIELNKQYSVNLEYWEEE